MAVINPYVGGLGDLMTMVEPSIAQAVQDIESSSFLPGFRLNAYLVAAWTCPQSRVGPRVELSICKASAGLGWKLFFMLLCPAVRTDQISAIHCPIPKIL